MSNLTIVGIDPGKNGAIAVLTPDGEVQTLQLAKATERDIAEFLSYRSPGVAYLEQVASSPQMGVVSAFNFGCSFGSLRMAVIASRLQLETVLPRKWQSAMRVKKIGGGFGKNDTEKKRATKARAQEIFPEIKITNAISDALLLMEFGRITRGVSHDRNRAV